MNKTIGDRIGLARFVSIFKTTQRSYHRFSCNCILHFKCDNVTGVFTDMPHCQIYLYEVLYYYNNI